MPVGHSFGGVAHEVGACLAARGVGEAHALLDGSRVVHEHAAASYADGLRGHFLEKFLEARALQVAVEEEGGVGSKSVDGGCLREDHGDVEFERFPADVKEERPLEVDLVGFEALAGEAL